MESDNIVCSVGPFYKHRPINLDTPQTSIAHARTYTRNISYVYILAAAVCSAGSSSDFVSFSELLTAYNRFGRVCYYNIIYAICYIHIIIIRIYHARDGVLL